MATRTADSAPSAPCSERFFASHRWPVALILVCVGVSVLAFGPRLLDYLSAGHWGQAATKATEFAPRALNAHALFAMALLPLFLVQPVLGSMLIRPGVSASAARAHRWHGWFLTLAAGLLSLLGFYIAYAFAIHSDSVTSIIFMFLVALLVILFFAQAVREARRRRIEGHLDALVFAMIFLSLPASGRLIEAAMRALGVENTRSRDLVSLGLGYHVELVDLTILMVSAVPILLWGVYAIPRQILPMHPAKLWIATAFFGLPFLAVTAQSVVR
ncbi:MAG: hypothetical protein K9L70_03490 [Thiohalocapsa sp.]|nr:hypothetical protein [Thiohalocapsa sp.]MCF7990121.1 hypothetical protein [Thiohalocapsa sp.]